MTRLEKIKIEKDELIKYKKILTLLSYEFNDVYVSKSIGKPKVKKLSWWK